MTDAVEIAKKILETKAYAFLDAAGDDMQLLSQAVISLTEENERLRAFINETILKCRCSVEELLRGHGGECLTPYYLSKYPVLSSDD